MFDYFFDQTLEEAGSLRETGCADIFALPCENSSYSIHDTSPFCSFIGEMSVVVISARNVT